MVLDLLVLTNSFNIYCVVHSHYINSDHDVMFFSKCMFNLNFKAVYAKQQTHWIVSCAYIWPFHSWEFSILPEIFVGLKSLSYVNKDYRCTANSLQHTSLQHTLIFSSFEIQNLKYFLNFLTSNNKTTVRCKGEVQSEEQWGGPGKGMSR